MILRPPVSTRTYTLLACTELFRSGLLLEKRQGHVGFVPATAVAAGKAPTDAGIATFYSHETARYTVPERRVIRYAVVMPDRVAEIGRASCRGRVCQYVETSVFGG